MYFRLKVNTGSSLQKHTVFLIKLYMILYDVCILLCHIYEKNIIEAAQLGHLHNHHYIRIDKLTRGHPSSRCRFSFELNKILRIT